MNNGDNKVDFPQSLLKDTHMNSSSPQSYIIHDNGLVLPVLYSEKQMFFHDFIDKISQIMTQYFNGTPQLRRSQAQDVHKHICALGKFVNPVSKKCIFNRVNLNLKDTIVKLNHLRLGLMRYSCINLSHENVLQEYCYELNIYIETIIKYIIKKDESTKALYTHVSEESTNFTDYY
jgi:hypothetical protein